MSTSTPGALPPYPEDSAGDLETAGSDTGDLGVDTGLSTSTTSAIAPIWTQVGTTEGGRLATYVRTIGDVDSDGVTELLLTESGWTPPGELSEGRHILLSGNPAASGTPLSTWYDTGSSHSGVQGALVGDFLQDGTTWALLQFAWALAVPVAVGVNVDLWESPAPYEFEYADYEGAFVRHDPSLPETLVLGSILADHSAICAPPYPLYWSFDVGSGCADIVLTSEGPLSGFAEDAHAAWAAADGTERLVIEGAVYAPPDFFPDNDAAVVWFEGEPVDGMTLDEAAGTIWGRKWEDMYLRAVGDTSGDGVGEIVIGAGELLPSTNRNGALFNEPLPGDHEWSEGVARFTIVGPPFRIGEGIYGADLGDVDQDGYDDLALQMGPRNTAAIFFGPLSGDLDAFDDASALLTMDEATGAFNVANFGSQVVGIEDVDGDTIRDLVVSAPLHDEPGKEDAGALYWYSGADLW